MQRILDGRELTNNHISKKTIGVIILVATLLLMGCTAYAFGNEIRDFFVKVYDSFIKVTFDEEQQGGKEHIEDIYYPSYMLEGYELVYEDVDLFVVIYEFKNSSGEMLRFDQSLLDGTNYFLDAENGEAELREIDNHLFYYKFTGQRFYYTWNDGKYAMTLTSSAELSDEDLINLFKGISLAN